MFKAVQLSAMTWRSLIAHSDRAAVAVLMSALAAAFSNVFSGSFQFDDYHVIVREASAHSLSAWWRSQPGIRPLLKLSYALKHESDWGLAGFHAVNLGIHAINTVLVFMMLGKLSAVQADPRQQRLAAFFAAALFALHPVQTEAVTYVSGRSTSLAAMFGLLSIVLWLHGRERGRAWATQWASPLALCVALACKEFAMVVPAALLLCARVQSGERGWLRSAWRDARIHGFVVALALAAACSVPRYRMLLDASLGTRDIASNLLTQANAVSYLVGQLLSLDAMNADPAMAAVSAVDGASVTFAAAWLAAILWALMAAPRHRVASFAVLWFVVWLAPTNSILPRLDVVNDRQLYVAMIGPAFGLASWAVRRMPSKPQAWVLPAICIALGCATWQRNLVYADEVAYWHDVAAKSPHNARAFANLGHALVLQGRNKDALAAFDVAVVLDPALYQAVINRRLLIDAMSGPGLRQARS